MTTSSSAVVPPSSAFIHDSNDAAATLNEPLLSSPQQNRTASSGSWTVPLHRLKLLSFVTGSLVAVASQMVLSQVLWKPTHEEHAAASKSTQEIVIFSLLWSFCTCLMIFGSMAGFVHYVGRMFYKKQRRSDIKTLDEVEPSATGNNTQDDELDGAMFQLEAHHIVGSLLSISLIWIVVDIIQSVAKHNASQAGEATWSGLGVPTAYQNVVYLMISVAWYVAFVRCVVQKQNGDKKALAVTSNGASGLMSTYQMIAATLGLISGLCSQFLLSFILWKDHMTKPVIDNVIVFSILWSLCTVVLTFFGCLSLRLLTLDENNRLTAERIFLRMESHFIFCSLIGICLAWILIDFIMDMREQIVPSILMLAVSLLAFTAIVAWFPEEKCLADLEDEIQLTEATSSTRGKEATVTAV